MVSSNAWIVIIMLSSFILTVLIVTENSWLLLVKCKQVLLLFFRRFFTDDLQVFLSEWNFLKMSPTVVFVWKNLLEKPFENAPSSVPVETKVKSNFCKPPFQNVSIPSRSATFWKFLYTLSPPKWAKMQLFQNVAAESNHDCSCYMSTCYQIPNSNLLVFKIDN